MYPKTPLYNQLKVQIQAKTDTEFQRFISDLFLKIYGSESFIPLREEKDKGCDGILVEEECVIACYGPKKQDKNKFEAKAKSDFDKYQTNWEAQYPNWKVIYNAEVVPHQVTIVDGLKKGSIVFGIEQILNLIEERLAHSKLRVLALDLGIDRDLISQDVLGEVLKDLLNDSIESTSQPKYKTVLYIEDKVKLNFDAKDVDDVLKEYSELIEYFPQVEALISGYEDQEKTSLKTRVLYDLNGIQGSLKDKLRNLTQLYLLKYSNENDDFYLRAIRTILIYLFEQCLIGTRTVEEVQC